MLVLHPVSSPSAFPLLAATKRYSLLQLRDSISVESPLETPPQTRDSSAQTCEKPSLVAAKEAPGFVLKHGSVNGYTHRSELTARRGLFPGLPICSVTTVTPITNRRTLYIVSPGEVFTGLGP
jgi:hypothetical protein